MARDISVNDVNLDEKAQEVLVYLYWHNDSYKTRKNIQDDLELSYGVVRRITDDLVDASLIEIESEEMYGSAKDRYQYRINSEGIRIVESRNLKQPKHDQVRGEVLELKSQTAYLKNRVEELREQLNEWKQYVKQHNKAKEAKIKQIEEKLEG